MLEKTIKQLLVLDGNETHCLNRELSYHNFQTIIIQLSRIKYGIRYHDYTRECQCQPEYMIKEILKTDTKLNKWLRDNEVLEKIETIVKSNINANKTVWESE